MQATNDNNVILDLEEKRERESIQVAAPIVTRNHPVSQGIGPDPSDTLIDTFDEFRPKAFPLFLIPLGS